MAIYDNSADWYEQSSLLIKAHPKTTRITSKYSVLKPTTSKISKRQRYLAKGKPKSASDSQNATAEQSTEDPATALTALFRLKAYDPVSGACLQYQTDKAAEVGRLIGTLGRLARTMGALPDSTTDFTMPAESGAGISTPTAAAATAKDQKGVVSGAAERLADKAPGAGGKKKKKGKK